MRKKVHRCQALDCMEAVDPKRLMCDKHWKLVPDSLKFTIANLWDTSKPHDEQPSRVLDFITMAVQQVGIVERKVMT